MDILEISIINIDSDIITKVADRCSVAPDRIRTYLHSKEEDNEFLRAFLFYGVSLINKTFQVPNAPR